MKSKHNSCFPCRYQAEKLEIEVPLSYYELRSGLPGLEFSLFGRTGDFRCPAKRKEGGQLMQFSYETVGSCATRIDIEIEAGLIVSAGFIDGCAGNTMAVAALVKGMPVEEAVRRLKGIICQGGTSCPDQLAMALEAAVMK